MLQIGCHLSSSKGYAAMAKTAASINANTFAFFTRNPRGGASKAIDPQDIKAYNEVAEQAGIKTIVAHGAYTVNPCASKPHVRSFAFEALADDLVRMENTPHQLFNMHPGSHVGQGAEMGIELIAEVLNEVIHPEQTTTVLLETMAGKGSEVGKTFQELAAIIDLINPSIQSHVGVCMDTCHVWDGGYDIVSNLEGVLEEFDTAIGLNRLKALHINDSLNKCGSHKDRHARIGEGEIGTEALANFVNHPSLRHLPMILETPNELEGYAQEIALFRNLYSCN